MRRCATFGRPLAFAFVLLFARTAQGQTSNEPAAEALFNEGRALIESGHVEEGCKKLEASHALDPGTGTLLHVGDCLEKLGRTATAWARFRDAAARAARDGRADWESIARSRAAELEPKLSKLRLDAPTGVNVQRDGDAIPTAALGSPLPIDPGDHDLTASAPGKKRWSTRVSVAAGATVSIAVPALEDEPPASDPAVPGGAGADARPAEGSSLRTVGFAVGGVGLIGLAVGTVSGLAAISLSGRSKDACPNDGICADERARSDNDDARSAATISTVAFVAGGALLAGGIALVIFNPAPAARTSARLRATPQALWLEGTW